MKLMLARHGQTQANLDQRFSGWSSSPLTDLGYIQAQQVAERITLKPDHLVTSDLERTQATAQRMIDHQDWHPLRMASSPAFREIHFGTWEGLTADQIQQADPILWQAYLDHPLAFTFPQGESFKDLERRVQQGIRCLDQAVAPQDRVLLVTHLGVIRLVQSWLSPQIGRSFWEYSLAQGTFQLIDLSNRHGQF